MADEIVCSSSTVFYWKKPSPWGDPHWTQCRWRLLENGNLLWDTYRPKGLINIHDSYHRIKIDSVDRKTFFNGVPMGIQMAPYVIILPMTTPTSITGHRERWFAVSDFNELKDWIWRFAKLLQAEDVLSEMIRRAKKELERKRNSAPREDEVLLESWKQFTVALRHLEQSADDSDEEDFSLGQAVMHNTNLLWAMSNATSSIQMSMI